MTFRHVHGIPHSPIHIFIIYYKHIHYSCMNKCSYIAGEQARTKNMYLRITWFSISPSFWDTVPLAMVKLLKKLLRQRIFEKGIGQVGPSVKISNVSLVIVDTLPIQKTDSQYSTTCSGYIYENMIVLLYFFKKKNPIKYSRHRKC
jgi:hypothetical protein